MLSPFDALGGPGALLVAAALLGTASSAPAQLTVSRFTIDGGGGTRSWGGAFALGGTLGQPDAGRPANSSFVLSGGFWFGGAAAVGIPAPGAGAELAAPLEFRIDPAAPNPVAHRTSVAFHLPAPTPVRAALYDVSGRLVRLLTDEPLAAGEHESVWDRRDESGRSVSSGIYFLRLDAGRRRSCQKLVVVR